MNNQRRQVDAAALAAQFQRQSEAALTDTSAGPAVARPPVSAYLAPRPAPRQMAEPAWMAQPAPVIAEGTWQPIVTQTEHSDPMTRAKATGLRMLAWGAIWLAAGLVTMAILAIVGAALPWAATFGGLLWVSLTAVTSYRVARLDHEVSAGGVERHRIDKGHDLAKAQMQHEYTLKRMALDAYLQTLERHDRAQLEDKRR